MRVRSRELVAGAGEMVAFMKESGSMAKKMDSGDGFGEEMTAHITTKASGKMVSITDREDWCVQTALSKKGFLKMMNLLLLQIDEYYIH